MTKLPASSGTFSFNSELVTFGLLAVLLAAIPLSKAVASIAEVLLALSWLIGLSNQQIRQRRFQTLKNAPYLLLFPAFYLIYPLGLLYTSDLTEGLQELNRKHYLFSLPLIIGTLQLSRAQVRWALLSFAVSNILVAVSVFYIVATGNDFLHGSTQIPSPFEQRPRASLFLCFSFFILAEYLVSKWYELSNEAKTTLIIFAGMLLGGLILMKGRIGQLGFVLLSPAFVLLYTKNTQRTRLRWLWAGGLSLCLAAGMYFGFEGVRQPFNEAYDELIESQTGYPTSEPSYSSIGQRVAFYQEYWPLFLENPIFGVGTGDLVREGKPLFADNPFGIPFNKPHNQFYETTLKFGLVGLALLLLAWGYTIRAFNPAFRKLAYLFSMLLFLSMWSDSTFGTQGGMSFFMVFTSLFLVRHNDPVWVQSEAPLGEMEPQTQLNAAGLR